MLTLGTSVSDDGKNLISFAIEKKKRYKTEYHPPKSDVDFEDIEKDEALLGFFEFDDDHIW
jgi:hypothetical protein